MSHFRAFQLLLLIWLPLSFWAEATGAADADTITKILADWEKQRNQFQDFECQGKGFVFYPKGIFTEKARSLLPPGKGPFPPADENIPKRAIWVVDFQKNYIRKETTGSSFSVQSLVWHPFHQVDLFDKKTLARFWPRDKRIGPGYVPSKDEPDAFIFSKEKPNTFLMVTDFPLFLATGHVFTNERDPDPLDLKVKLQKSDFAVMGDAILHDTKCVVLKSSRVSDSGIDQYWISSDRRSAILRWCRFEDGVIGGYCWAQIDIDYQRKDMNWVPKEWTVATYVRGKTNMVDMAETLSISTQPSKTESDIKDYQLPLRPGDNLEDQQKKKTFRVQEDGSLLEINEHRTKVGSWVWIAVLGLLLLVAVLSCVKSIRTKGIEYLSAPFHFLRRSRS